MTYKFGRITQHIKEGDS